MSSLTLHISKVPGNVTTTITAELSDDVSVIRGILANNQNVEPSQIVIICNGVNLKDGYTVKDYDLGIKSNLRYVVRTGPKPKPEAPGNKINLSFFLYEGHNYNLTVPLHIYWGEVKKMLEEKTKMPASELRLIHAQAELMDDVRVIESNVMDASKIFCVLKPNTSSHLDKVIDENSLKCTCRYCETQGAKLAVRPFCSSCKGECVLYDAPGLVIGTTKWRDLLSLRGVCINEGCKNFNNSQNLSFGIMCEDCPTAIHVLRKRLATIEAGSTEDTLLKSLNDLYSYAHLNGALE
ncbi:hypothetical protein WA158_003952 [Blastocystis sp. Blastoise]